MWRESIAAFRGINILTPLVIVDRIYTSAQSVIVQLFEISRTADGQWNVIEVWNQKTQAYMSSPVVVGKSIILHAKNQRVIASSISDGSIRWTSPPQAKYWSMVAQGDRILALDETGDLRLIKATPDAFTLVGEAKVSDLESWAHLAIAGDQIAIRDLDRITLWRWK